VDQAVGQDSFATVTKFEFYVNIFQVGACNTASGTKEKDVIDQAFSFVTIFSLFDPATFRIDDKKKQQRASRFLDSKSKDNSVMQVQLEKIFWLIS
jgi:hypothetical protein